MSCTALNTCSFTSHSSLILNLNSAPSASVNDSAEKWTNHSWTKRSCKTRAAFTDVSCCWLQERRCIRWPQQGSNKLSWTPSSEAQQETVSWSFTSSYDFCFSLLFLLFFFFFWNTFQSNVLRVGIRSSEYSKLSQESESSVPNESLMLPSLTCHPVGIVRAASSGTSKLKPRHKE